MGRLTTDRDDPGLKILKANGQQEAYLVLTPDELAKGFIRRPRFEYKHLRCGQWTMMSKELGQTYARDPHFYGATFCCVCRDHFPVGESGEFIWDDGTKVGT
jgi:hypothetical protein